MTTKDKSRKTEKEAQPAKPSKPAKKPTEEDVLKVMARLEANGVVEFTSTLLRDKLELDKESGRDQIRRIMKKLAADGKVEMSKKVFDGKRKRYVYSLKKESKENATTLRS